MATHSSFLAWRIPMDSGAGGPQSMGSQRAGHDWATKHQHHVASTFKRIQILHSSNLSQTLWSIYQKCLVSSYDRIKWYCNLAKFMLGILMKLNLSQTIIFTHHLDKITHHFDKITQLEWTELLGPFDKRFNGLASSTFCPQKFILQIGRGHLQQGETLALLTHSLLKASDIT